MFDWLFKNPDNKNLREGSELIHEIDKERKNFLIKEGMSPNILELSPETYYDIDFIGNVYLDPDMELMKEGINEQFWNGMPYLPIFPKVKIVVSKAQENFEFKKEEGKHRDYMNEYF